MSQKIEEMNIHQKLLKIAIAAGVLQKTKDGYNYKYVPEEEIQAKVTACMQKYGVMLHPSIAPNTLNVMPYTYQKMKTKKVKNAQGKDEIVEYTVTVNEVITHCEVVYTWVNTDKPEEKVECRWGYVGQMEDAGMSFSAGATIGNRYFLMKALQLATTEADPDTYRAKQKKAEQYEETEEIKELAAEIIELGTKLITLNEKNKKIVPETVSKFNNGNPNPNSIKNVEAAEQIIVEFKNLIKEETNKESKTKKEGK